MSRTLLTLAAAAVLLAPDPARANLESEAVVAYDPLPAQVVEAPRDSYRFGVPNVSEFDPNPAARTGPVRLAPYPDEPIQDRDD